MGVNAVNYTFVWVKQIKFQYGSIQNLQNDLKCVVHVN